MDSDVRSDDDRMVIELARQRVLDGGHRRHYEIRLLGTTTGRRYLVAAFYKARRSAETLHELVTVTTEYFLHAAVQHHDRQHDLAKRVITKLRSDHAWEARTPTGRRCAEAAAFDALAEPTTSAADQLATALVRYRHHLATTNAEARPLPTPAAVEDGSVVLIDLRDPLDEVVEREMFDQLKRWLHTVVDCYLVGRNAAAVHDVVEGRQVAAKDKDAKSRGLGQLRAVPEVQDLLRYGVEDVVDITSPSGERVDAEATESSRHGAVNE